MVSDAQFIVQTIYFQPQGTPDKTADIRKMMADVHDFFGREMQRHGFGFKTFRIEKDATDQIVVHTVKGKHPTASYIADTTYTAIEPELPARFKTPNNSHIIFVGGMQRVHSGGNRVFGVATSIFGKYAGGYAVLPANQLNFHAVVHEAAHTFGIQHNIDPITDFIMGVDSGYAGFAEYEARWMDKSHYFNDAHRTINFVPKVVRLHPIRVIDIPNHIIEIKVDVESPNGIHQAEIARLGGGGGVLDTHFLHANPKETAVFQFNVRLLRGETQAAVRVMDTHGNFWGQHTDLDIPPAAFFVSEPEPTTPLKPIDEPIKPIKPSDEPINPKADDETQPEKDDTDDTPRAVNARRKFIVLWAKLKQ